VIFKGDGNVTRLVAALQRKGCKVSVVSPWRRGGQYENEEAFVPRVVAFAMALKSKPSSAEHRLCLPRQVANVVAPSGCHWVEDRVRRAPL
jgi:hypothetical protein